MEGLMKSVTLGVYPPINSKFSKDLAHVIKMMLQQKAKARPSAEKLFSSGLIKNKLEELQIVAERMQTTENVKEELLKTIRIPKKLHYLTDRLPKPNYENFSDPGQSPISSSKLNKSLKNSLPKLNRALEPNGSTRLTVPDKRKKRSVIG